MYLLAEVIKTTLKAAYTYTEICIYTPRDIALMFNGMEEENDAVE